MLTATEIAGFAGAGLAGTAYIPQISHLIRARCSAGISRLAFEAWLLASVLTTARAIAIGAGVFIMLGGIQIVATALIMVCTIRYKDTPCPVHPPGQPAAMTATRTGTSGDEPGSRRLAGRPAAASATPAGHGGALRAHVAALRRHCGAVTARPPVAAAVPGAGGGGPGSSRPRTERQARHPKETT
jgi:hypothetical protein